VRRTNIYLSAAEQEALDARAAVEGCSRSDIVRGAIDRELNLDDDKEVDALIGDLAAELAEVARRSSADDPDLRSE
jgi:Ribbon-helix-helix protein, copG family